jgi:2-acylglycerol O-acyltransferase 2
MNERVKKNTKFLLLVGLLVLPRAQSSLLTHDTYTIISDASRSSVHRALTDGARIGLAPGGIAEMFEGYPKPLTHPHDEYAIVRKGFLKLAWQHQIPVIPVYCFGATKMLRRLQLPHVVESISLLLRVSICILFGQWGLPIPFRQKLLYVMGNPIIPPPLDGNDGIDQQRQQQQVDDMHAKFCQELLRLFEAHKESYGWGRKTLRILQGSSSS